MRLVRVVTSTRCALRRPHPDLREQVVHLALHRPDLEPRVHEAGGADHLLDHDAPRLLQLVGARRGGDVERLADPLLELLEAERAVVEGRGQAEAVLDERRLALAVAVVHPAHLRDRLVGLVHDDQGVLRQVVEERGRRLARLRGPRGGASSSRCRGSGRSRAASRGRTSCAGRGAGPRGACPGVSSRGFTSMSSASIVFTRVGEPRLRRDVVARGVDRHLGEPPRRLPGQRVEGADPLHLVPEQLDADAALLVGGHDLDHVAPHPEGAALQLVVVAVVAGLDEAREQVPPVEGVALPDEEEHPVVGLGRAEAVDAGDGRHDQDVAALEEAPGGGEAQPVDLLVDRGLLLDVGVRLRDVGLGLVVVVVGDEVLDGVARGRRP